MSHEIASFEFSDDLNVVIQVLDFGDENHNFGPNSSQNPLNSVENPSKSAECPSNAFNWLFYDLADPRIRDYLFFGNPLLIFSIYLFYLIFCIKILPYLMKNREPMTLKWTSWALENLIFNISTFFMMKFGKIWMNFNWRCEAMDESKSEEVIWVSKVEVTQVD